MKIGIKALVLGAHIILVVNVFADEQNLNKIADDMKYQSGVRMLQLEQNDSAVELFMEYLEIYHDGIHRDEAYKNVADIYFKKQDYINAIRMYLALYEEYSDSEQGAAAYYRVGLCYVKMGDLARAQQVFQHIIDEHFNTQYAHKAKLQVDLLDLIK